MISRKGVPFLKTHEFFDAMAAASPQFDEVMREHMADNDSLLPHLLMTDLLRYVEARAASEDGDEELTEIFRLLDEAFVDGDTKSAIAVSFIEDIDAEPFLTTIEPYFGPALKAEEILV